jgi:hypothetical protein
MIVAGIDWSSKAIDVALIPLDTNHGDAELENVTLRRDAIPQIDPLERPWHAANITVQLLRDVAGYTVSDVFVEEPWTRSWTAAGAMFPVYGAILAGGRLGGRRIHALSSNQWRTLLNLPRRLEKASAVEDAIRREPLLARSPITDHAAEAYLIALAGRKVVRRELRSRA